MQAASRKAAARVKPFEYLIAGDNLSQAWSPADREELNFNHVATARD
jgi:hypothetical protein